MQHRLERPLPHFVLENGGDIVVGIPGVDHQRQSAGARGRDMGSEDPGRDVPRRVIVMVIEAGLADSDAFRMGGEFDQALGRNVRLFGGLMRMGADRIEHVRKALGEGAERIGSAPPWSRW